MKHTLTAILGIFEIVYWLGFGQLTIGGFKDEILTLAIIGAIIPPILLFQWWVFREPKQQNLTINNEATG